MSSSAVGEAHEPERTPEPIQIADDSSTEPAKRAQQRLNRLEAKSQAEQAKLMFQRQLEVMPKAMLLLLPVFALILKVMFLGTGRSYVEHLVFVLHTHAMIFFVFTLSFLIDGRFLGVLLSFGLVTYVFLALRNAYESGWVATVARLVGLLVVYTILAAAVTVGTLAV